MLTISNDRLKVDGRPVTFVHSPNQGGRISPTIIVLHDTAGRLTKGSSVSWFKDPKAKVSAHFVVELDGSVTQMVDCDRAAWHAGVSSWGGRSGCNSFSIGMEIVSPGKLTPKGVAWFGQAFEGFHEAATPAHGKGCWLSYPPAQVEAVKAICKALVEAYPIKDIVTHWQISPRRKVDTNPLFPLNEVRAWALTRKTPVGTDHWPLELGSEGDHVRLLQVHLLSLGYSMVKHADGVFGPQTRAGVVAWEAENGVTLDGKIDRVEFERLMAPESKELPIGPATAQAEADKASSANAIEAVAVTGATTSAVIVADAQGNSTLWDILMQSLGHAGEAVSKVQVLGVKIEPHAAMAGLATVVAIAMWRWARKAKG